MSDAMCDLYAQQDLEEWFTTIKRLVGMGKNSLAYKVAVAAEDFTIAKYKGRPRRWQRQIRAKIDREKGA